MAVSGSTRSDNCGGQNVAISSVVSIAATWTVAAGSAGLVELAYLSWTWRLRLNVAVMAECGSFGWTWRLLLGVAVGAGCCVWIGCVARPSQPRFVCTGLAYGGRQGRRMLSATVPASGWRRPAVEAAAEPRAVGPHSATPLKSALPADSRHCINGVITGGQRATFTAQWWRRRRGLHTGNRPTDRPARRRRRRNQASDRCPHLADPGQTDAYSAEIPTKEGWMIQKVILRYWIMPGVIWTHFWCFSRNRIRFSSSCYRHVCLKFW